MSDSPDLVAIIRRIAEEVVGRGPTPRNSDRHTRLSDGHWLDSIELFELVLACEAEFGIAFDEPTDLDPGTFETLGTFADLVGAKLAARESRP